MGEVSFVLERAGRNEYILSFRVLKTGKWHSEAFIAKDNLDARMKAINKHGEVEFLWVI